MKGICRKKKKSESHGHTVSAGNKQNESSSFSVYLAHLGEQVCCLIYHWNMWAGQTVCHGGSWSRVSDGLLCQLREEWCQLCSFTEWLPLGQPWHSPAVCALWQAQLLQRGRQPSSLTCRVPAPRNPRKSRAEELGRREEFLRGAGENQRVMPDVPLWTWDHIGASHKCDSVFHPASLYCGILTTLVLPSSLVVVKKTVPFLSSI